MNFAQLDTLVTVVDAMNVYEVLASLETLADDATRTKMIGTLQNPQVDAHGNVIVQEIATCTDPTHDHFHDGEPEVDDRSIVQLMLDQIVQIEI